MKKFENIILASDIDGTFIFHSNPPHINNIERIKYFTENGGRFLFSSGRNHKDIKVVAKEIMGIVNAPCVLCNGGMLYDIKADTIENPVFLDTERAYELFCDVEKKFPDIGFRSTFDGGFLIREYDESIINELKGYNILDLATLAPLEAFSKTKMYKTVFRSTKERLGELRAYLDEKYGNDFNLTRSTETILELMPKGITKAYQLTYLKEKYKKDNGNVKLFCIGDFDNDIDMLKCADVAACPENASPTVAELCTEHLCHCKDGAVGMFIDVIEKKYI